MTTLLPVLDHQPEPVRNPSLCANARSEGYAPTCGHAEADHDETGCCPGGHTNACKRTQVVAHLDSRERYVIHLAWLGMLRYLAPSQEWTHTGLDPLSEAELDAADRLWRNGLLPNFDGCGLPDNGQIDPDACAWCDTPRTEHLQQWAPERKWHGWAEPSDALRLARMTARHTARTSPERTTT